MKVLVFSPYYPPHIGGLESHADEFNKYLSREGADITVFTPRLPKTAPEKEIKYDSVRVIRFPAFEIIPNYPLPKFWTRKYRELKQEINNEKFDIVVSRTRFFNTSLLALIYAKTKKVKWIHIEHGSDFVKSGGRLSVFVAKLYDYTLGKTILNSADVIIANSKASANFCKKLAKKIDCEVIYRGLEIEKILAAPADAKLKEKYRDQVIITFLGRLYDGKGAADLLTALSKIKNRNYIGFIIGDGPEKEKLKTLSEKLKIENKIIFFGYKLFADYIKMLKITDIFVNPSYTEGLPTTVAEAGLCHNAIIATNVGGTREIITDEKSGFLIEPKNIASLRDKLDILIDNKNLRRQFGKNAYAEIKSKFDWGKSIEKYWVVFKKNI